MMADRGELKAKGRDGVLRVVPLGEGFTAALIEARLDFDPAFFHEAVGQARKAEELQYARDGPDRTSGEDDRLRRLAEEAIGAK